MSKKSPLKVEKYKPSPWEGWGGNFFIDPELRCDNPLDPNYGKLDPVKLLEKIKECEMKITEIEPYFIIRSRKLAKDDEAQMDIE